nr:hypothetical protein [Tanacetum cinerariifolium]
MLKKHQLTRPNFNEWFHELKLVVRTEKLHDVFETALPPAPAAGADAQALADWAVLFYRHNEVACLMLETIIKRNKQPIVGASFTPQVMAIQGGRVQKYKLHGKAKGKGKWKGYHQLVMHVDVFETALPPAPAAGADAQALADWVVPFNCHIEVTCLMLGTMKRKGKRPQNSYPTKPKKPQPYKKERSAKDGVCHHNKEEGHWKRNCPMYLAELMKKKKKTRGQNVASTSSGIYTIELFAFPKNSWVYDTGCGTHICNIKQGLRGARKLKCSSLYLYVGNGVRAEVEAIGSFDLVLPNGLIIVLDNYMCQRKVLVTSLPLLMIIVVMVMFIYLSIHEVFETFKLTPPYTPQHNGVSKRHNRTLLNMVRSMMSLATLPLSFRNYALESAARILNMVLTKKVDKTPYELWHGKVYNLSYLKDFILQKESGRIVELEDKYILPSENTSEHPIEEESLALIVSQEADVILIRRFVRTHKALDRLCLNVEIDPDRLCFNVEVKEHSLGDLNEPANYKATLSNPKFEKWLVPMNAEMQSMYDNKVWRLVVLPPNAKVVKSKWIYKKKTDMDSKETFSPVADIRAIRILIAIAAYYDYEICLQEVKTYLGKCCSMKDLGEATFILGIKIYRDRSRRLIGLSQNAYLDKILKRYRMDNSKRGSIPMIHYVCCEVLIVDHADVIAMQNWSHLNTVVKYLNHIPSKQHGTHIMHIRPWYLDGQARFYRYTIYFKISCKYRELPCLQRFLSYNPG